MKGSDLAVQEGAVFHENRARAGIDVKVLQSETQRESVEQRMVDRQPARIINNSIQVTHMLSGSRL